MVTQDHRTFWSTVTHLECQAPHQFDSQRLNLPTLTRTPKGTSRRSLAISVTENRPFLRHGQNVMALEVPDVLVGWLNVLLAATLIAYAM
ncbi:hypothetical protein LH935_16505 [Gordonia polyisoprenivorans]|uniref:hypothetical protein n=1 Tax=Gordonia polyisoprenivorans TaxID=84595 RepID=UPI0022348ADB|nr:hypothetical protein LH935_16505 [Gordonia polyisoprenivorans]